MAKFCYNCGAELKEGVTFCSSCGSRVQESAVDIELRNHEATDRGPETIVNKKNLKFIVWCVLLLFIVVGATVFITRSTPEKTVNKFVKSYNNQNVNGMLECLDPNTRNLYIGMMTMINEADIDGLFKDVIGSIEFTMNAVHPSIEIDIDKVNKISNSKVIMETEYFNPEADVAYQGTRSIDMIKINGVWYITLLENILGSASGIEPENKDNNDSSPERESETSTKNNDSSNDNVTEPDFINEASNNEATTPPQRSEQSQFVYDEAQLLSENELEDLETMCKDYGKQANYEFFILTHNNSKAVDAETYIENFEDKMNVADGVYILIDMANRVVFMEGYGLAEDYVNSIRIDTIIDEITPYLSDGNYYDALQICIKSSTEYMKDAGASETATDKDSPKN